jgi:hypothetical protein
VLRISAAGRDIGDIPPVVDGARKAAASRDLRTFCEAYFPSRFTMPWSDDHLRVIALMETVTVRGGMFAVAMPRGDGKTTIAEVATLWAVFCQGHPYVYLIGSCQEDGDKLLTNLKVELMNNPRLLADFPEIVYPIHRLEGQSRRCGGQIHHGEPTHIGWLADRVILPMVPGSRAAGALIRVGSLVGHLRGGVHSRPDGRRVRPTLAIVDDPQTTQSARSPSQCVERERVIQGDVRGLAGPGQKISVLIPCTVIREDDLADRLLNREIHPEWQGIRTRMVYAFPKNTGPWDRYAELRAEGMREEDGGAKGTAFYRENREAMDEGARVSWAARHNEDELSALQHAMNLRIDDELAFFAEYQNEPKRDAADRDRLTPADVCARVNGRDRGEVPQPATCLTMFIDVHDRLLYWLVVAWETTFTGYLIDYGTFPDQRRSYFSLRDATRTLGRRFPGTGVEGAIQAGLLKLVTGDVGALAREFRRADGAVMKLDRILIDAGYQPQIVANVVRKAGAVVSASKGAGLKAGHRPMSTYKRKPGEKYGHHWMVPNVRGTRELRHVRIDTNYWKTFCHDRLATAPGDPASLTIFGDKPGPHRLLAEHIAGSETWTRTEGHGRVVHEWTHKPSKPDNHWLDCLVGCAVAASMAGIVTPDAAAEKGRPPTRRKRVVRYLS